MKEYLMTAGPTPVPERVLLAMAGPVLHHRAPAFITIAGGQDHLKGKIVRMAHIGYYSEFDIVTAISGLEMTLSDLGYGIKPGAGVAAAQASFAQTRRSS